MRNLLMMLILANVLYFMWDRFVEKPEQIGVAVIDENRLGPPLVISKMAIAGAATSVGAVLGSGRPSGLAAVVGRSCVSITFRKSAEAGSALAEYRDTGMRASLRSARGEVFIGHWVQIRNIPDRETGNRMLALLDAGGISDVILIESDGAYKISLGLFGEVSRAERRELEARSLDLPADVTPRMQDAQLYFVDLALLPGQGAGAMIERYGEDRVLLREKATCPTSD